MDNNESTSSVSMTIIMNIDTNTTTGNAITISIISMTVGNERNPIANTNVHSNKAHDNINMTMNKIIVVIWI